MVPAVYSDNDNDAGLVPPWALFLTGGVILSFSDMMLTVDGRNLKPVPDIPSSIGWFILFSQALNKLERLGYFLLARFSCDQEDEQVVLSSRT